jgi:hypothetical protein
MAEPVEPRTLLEAMVRQRQLTWDEAADLVVKTAKQHENASISLSGRHLGRLARSERAGNRPNPATRRALQYAFGRTVDELLAPYSPGDLIVAAESDLGLEPSEVVAVAGRTRVAICDQSPDNV